MGAPRPFSTAEIKSLRSIVDDDAFVHAMARLARVIRQVADTPIPSPLDSENKVARLIECADNLLQEIREADKEGHPLALTMKNKGWAGSELLRNTTIAVESLLPALNDITKMSRPGLKKSRGRKGENDLAQYLADSIVDILVTYSVEPTRYKNGSLAKCILAVRSVAGLSLSSDPCKGIKVRLISS